MTSIRMPQLTAAAFLLGEFNPCSSALTKSLRRGERLEVEVPEAGGCCWIVRKADLARLLGMEIAELPMTSVSALVDAALQDDDSDDPWLASYQSCRP